MTGEDFQFINPHCGNSGSGAPQMVEAGEGGYQHSQYSPKHEEVGGGGGGGARDPYYIADKTMTELSGLAPPYDNIDGAGSAVNYANYHSAEAAAATGEARTRASHGAAYHYSRLQCLS